MDSCSYVCKIHYQPPKGCICTPLTPSKSATECVWVYAQSGSEKCVRLLDFCLSKLPSNQPAIHVRPLTKVPVDSEKPWYCRSQVEVKYPTWAFRSGRIWSFNWVFAKVVPEMLTQGTRVWMLFVHMSKPQVCKRKQLVHFGKQYEEAHDSIKEEKPFVAKCWSAWRISQCNNFLNPKTVHSTWQLLLEYGMEQWNGKWNG